MRSKDGMLIDGLILEPSSRTPMYRQLYSKLREMVLSGVLPGNARMPSSRTLSNRLGVSRFTVVTALDQLVAEGYLKSVAGSGTFVEVIPNVSKSLPPTSIKNHDVTKSDGDLHLLSKLARGLTWRNSMVLNRDVKYLHMSAPDHRLFPFQTWTKLTREVFSNIDNQTAYYRDTSEPSPLERQISAQIFVSRGIRCDPEEVVTTFGAHHAVDLLTELFLDPEDTVAFEEPGMSAVRSIFQSKGCNVLPMYVDKSGANPSTLFNHDVKLAFVTAAKQQPLTIAMPVKRKLELLSWATEKGTIIVEDDLGSEFRYKGGPIPPLKAMDQGNNVIYIGAFSMSLLQTLRIGFMIMPRNLAEYCRRMIQVRYRSMPQVTEQVLARFIEDGHFSRHLHKTRRIYAKRQERLLEILQTKFQAIFEPPEFTAGFYSLCYFKDQSLDVDYILSQCNKHGLGVEQLSYYYRNKLPQKKGLLIGFASSTEEELEIGTGLLLDYINASQSQKSLT